MQLIKQNDALAAELYVAAASMVPKETGFHESTWLQARRLMEVLAPFAEEYGWIAKVYHACN